MQKILFTICIAIGALNCFAQTDSHISYGIKGGVNFSNLHESVDGQSGSASSGSLTSFNAGVFADLKVNDLFSVQPQLLYTGKGATDKENEEDGFSGTSDIKLNLYYLHLPVYALLHPPVTDDDFFIGIGPFLSYGLSGREKGTIVSTIEEPLPPNNEQTVTQTTNINNKVNFGNSDSSDVKRTDYGVSAIAGYKLKNGFLVTASYDFGLSNIASSDVNIKTRVFSISVGYSF